MIQNLDLVRNITIAYPELDIDSVIILKNGDILLHISKINTIFAIVIDDLQLYAITQNTYYSHLYKQLTLIIL